LVAYELGYRLQPTKAVSVDLTGFYNSYNRLGSVKAGAPQPGVPVIIPINLANEIEGDTFGSEIATTLDVTDNWRLAGSYSLLEAAFHPTAGSTDTADAKNYEGSAPVSQAQIHSYWDITRNLQLNCGVYFTGRVTEFDIPAYVLADVNVVWRLKNDMEFKAGIMSPFDNHHPEYGVTQGQGLASEPPRTLYAELSYKF
jgi:iron complex outermembrane recepter protein